MFLAPCHPVTQMSGHLINLPVTLISNSVKPSSWLMSPQAAVVSKHVQRMTRLKLLIFSTNLNTPGTRVERLCKPTCTAPCTDSSASSAVNRLAAVIKPSQARYSEVVLPNVSHSNLMVDLNDLMFEVQISIKSRVTSSLSLSKSRSFTPRTCSQASYQSCPRNTDRGSSRRSRLLP